MPDFTHLDIDCSAELCGQLRDAPQIGIDTEFMREKTYFPQLCLIQVSIDRALYCVDPLAGDTPDAFWPSLLAPEWILHSGRQDLEVVYLAAGRLPDRVYDTQIAAALLGYAPQMGYARLVADLFDVELAKSQTRADWSRRPLSAAALEYAAEDVEYLLPAWELLRARLDKLGRLPWAMEDSADLLDPALYRVDTENAVGRLKGARTLQGRARRAAVGLANWREQQAETSDKPRQWILRDAVLLELANAAPDDRRALASIDGLPPATARRAAGELLDILAAARNTDDDYQPPDRLDESQKALLKQLQQKVAVCARELGIAPEVLAARKELSAAFAGNASGRVFRGWRRQAIGDELLAMLG